MASTAGDRPFDPATVAAARDHGGPELADVLQVGYDEQAGRWWLCCPGCDRRRDVHDEAQLARAVPPFLDAHAGCH